MDLQRKSFGSLIVSEFEPQCTSQGLTMVVDRFAEDISDLSRLNKIRLKEAEIMGLDPQ